MIDSDHDKINFERLGVYGGIFAGTVWFWYSVFTMDFLLV